MIDITKLKIGSKIKLNGNHCFYLKEDITCYTGIITRIDIFNNSFVFKWSEYKEEFMSIIIVRKDIMQWFDHKNEITYPDE